MTRTEEIKERLEEIENEQFRLKMIDRWSNDIYTMMNRLSIEERQLEEELKQLEKE